MRRLIWNILFIFALSLMPQICAQIDQNKILQEQIQKELQNKQNMIQKKQADNEQQIVLDQSEFVQRKNEQLEKQKLKKLNELNDKIKLEVYNDPYTLQDRLNQIMQENNIEQKKQEKQVES